MDIALACGATLLCHLGEKFSALKDEVLVPKCSCFTIANLHCLSVVWCVSDCPFGHIWKSNKDRNRVRGVSCPVSVWLFQVPPPSSVFHFGTNCRSVFHLLVGRFQGGPCVFRLSATSCRIGLMESRMCSCRGGPPPLAG